MSDHAPQPHASQPSEHSPSPMAETNSTNPNTPNQGGGLSVIQYWAEKTLSPQGPKLWQTLLHKSACLSCAWGTGGQKGGFTNQVGESMQCCMKSVESIVAELQPPVSDHFFARHAIADLQQLTSMEADRLGRLSFPVIWRAGQSHYERIDWSEIYAIAETAFRPFAPAMRAKWGAGLMPIRGHSNV